MLLEWDMMYFVFNSLPNYKILALTKVKAFADHKSNIAKMIISVFDRVECIVIKRESELLIFP